jgi:hypothetical protein
MKLKKYLSYFRTLVKLKNQKKRNEEIMPTQTPTQANHDEQYEMRQFHTDIDKKENIEKISDNTGKRTNGAEDEN